jgi:hypothetical protein
MSFSSQKRPSNTSKHELLQIIVYFCGPFLPSWIRIRIRIPNTDLDLDPDPDSEYGSGSGSTDPIEYGSNTDPDPVPDPQPCFKILKFSLFHGVRLRERPNQWIRNNACQV